MTLAGRRVPLTDTQYRLLVELAIDLGTPVAYEDLLQQVWASTLRSTVKSLRRKLGDEARNPTCIFNESKVGYRLGMADKSPEVAGPRQARSRRNPSS